MRNDNENTYTSVWLSYHKHVYACFLLLLLLVRVLTPDSHGGEYHA